MGQYSKKICSGLSLIFVIIAIFIPCSSIYADINSIGTVSMERFTSPKYNEKTKKLEYIVTGKNACSIGPFIRLTDFELKLIGEDGKSIDSLITTPEAYYNRALEIIKGDKSIHYRSKAADADGVGFDCSLRTQRFHIRNNVKMVFRSTKNLQDVCDEPSSPKESKDVLEKKAKD